MKLERKRGETCLVARYLCPHTDRACARPCLAGQASLLGLEGGRFPMGGGLELAPPRQQKAVSSDRRRPGEQKWLLAGDEGAMRDAVALLGAAGTRDGNSNSQGERSARREPDCDGSLILTWRGRSSSLYCMMPPRSPAEKGSKHFCGSTEPGEQNLARITAIAWPA